ncbi:phosphatidylethanolamine/phosphatidyl-N-methylethanolamine N-methyltransferase [Natronocella acetinitrilica]|jgi:phosphatidylethanolamine/phosphatidyl-N-methylethanolamine N-methyltransferase|uniref:Phosphatidylethanolamine/phosphatidyl-N-methylethanolamine N-methyltransferase n=1 Tax=Natronocella acetinitrilica TaxID=414046 RepID=A0AAE3G102_9GAMM|nr:class I SAM-dependent methyltransferase [Natronocella acetinitrilica]MCP1673780.1 phosphatidylethanolamine/phosphatidyl-N-methylethanolamine N-methyltransferase [Natronocella acetinitrilica]
MDLDSIRSAYRRYANHYDRIFGPVFNPGRKLAMQALDIQSGDRVLEVGVGTGLSLPYYPEESRVVGIDISPEMLAKAQARAREQGLDQVEDLLVMDAEALEFPDNSFDAVVAMYVASVVPHPDRLISEMRRVCVPGGDILIINHFASTNPVLRGLEKGLRPLSKLLGFRPDMDLASLPEQEDFQRIGVRNANIFGYWKLVHYRNGEVDAPVPDQARVAAGK